MNIRRFFGKNSREALTIVRRELGDDAVILSNRAVAGGNEIMAFTEVEMNAMVNANPAHMASEPSEAKPWLSLLNKNASEEHQGVDANSMGSTAKASNLRPTPINHDADVHNNLQSNKSNVATSKQMVWMLKEMRSMRNVIESQLATIAWGNIQQRDLLSLKC